MPKGEKQPVALTLPQLLLLSVVVAAVLILPGSDIYTQIHQAWLYNHMMLEEVILSEDFTMLSGHQPLYSVGSFSHLLSGAAWFAFQKSSVKVLETALFAGLVLVTLAVFRNRNMLFFWYGLVFVKVLLPDSYPYLFSAFLFYLGVYLIRRFRKSPLGDGAILLAGLNHPYVAVSNLVTIFSGRWLLFLFSVAIVGIQALVMKYLFFSGTVNFELDNLLDMTIRSAVLLFPFIADWLPRGIARLANLKSAFVLVIAGILLAYPLLYVPFEMGWKEGISCYYQKSYAELPQIDGNVRMVDDCRSWIYSLPVMGMVSSLSPYFEGQHYQRAWTKDDYLAYILETNTSFVVFCKECRITTKTFQETGELEILEANFISSGETANFRIFDTRSGALHQQ